MGYEDLQQQAQQRLVEFLRAELELARTFVEAAKRHLKEGDREGYESLLQKSVKAIDAVHFLEDQISDPRVKVELQQDFEELEQLLFSDGE